MLKQGISGCSLRRYSLPRGALDVLLQLPLQHFCRLSGRPHHTLRRRGRATVESSSLGVVGVWMPSPPNASASSHRRSAARRQHRPTCRGNNTVENNCSGDTHCCTPSGKSRLRPEHEVINSISTAEATITPTAGTAGWLLACGAGNHSTFCPAAQQRLADDNIISQRF